nr:zinc finger, CCHC-type [Tanacetum cinerariifolium]
MTNGESVKDMTSKFDKLAKFEGQDFRRWQKKMHFLLTTLKVVYVLSAPSRVWSENETLETTRKRMKWENEDYICRGHILNEDAYAKKFLVSNFMNYKMVDTRPVIEQYHEMLRILGQYTQHNLMMDDAISVAIIIDKLPPSWKEFKHGLKHKKEELNLVQLSNHLRIKEGLRNQKLDNNPKGKNQIGSSSVNMVEGDGAKNSNNNKNKRKFKSGDEKFSNKKGTDDEVAWWVDSGAKSHVCKDLRWFQNEIAERKNRTLKEMINSMLSYSRLSERFWGEAMLTAYYILNRTPNKNSKQTPYEIWTKKVPNLTYLRIWGRRAVVRLTEPKIKNLESKDVIFDEERLTSIPRPRGMIQPSSSKIAEDEVEEVVQTEIDSTMHNDTWELTDLPPGCKALGCKWILKMNLKVDGSIDKYKARLVIQGFRKKDGIDFFDTYVPVARIFTIRLLLALADIHDLVIHQMDVKTAFLNGDLDEEIYMKQPGGFVMHGQESKCVYSKFDTFGKRVIICLYVDDMLIFDTDQDQVNKTNEFLSSKFNMKDLEEADVILGIRIKRGNNVSQLEYSRAIGCLMYPMINTRPDIAFAVGKLSRYTSNPSALHWQAPGGAISWASNKQTCITSSTIESEFVALAAAGNEAEWLRNLVYEILLWPKPISTISIRCDSAATLAKAYSQVYNGKSRHSIIRELIMNGVISVEFVRTQLNLADHLTKGFYVIEPNDYVSVNSIIESRDAIFDEERFTSIPRPRGMIQLSSSKTAGDEVEGNDDVPGLSEDLRTLSEAMASRDVAFWKKAVQSEIDFIMHNDTWELTDLPPGCKALGCKWILKRKIKVDGSIDKYKARLVIQGFRQKEGIDFFDTYALVARISTIRLVLALAAIHDLVIHQMDVKTAFLNGDLDEEIYIKQPEGFVMHGHESKVCKLKKSLYGLKQAPKQWHQKFDDVVLSNGFSLNQADKCAYSKFNASDLGEAEVILGIRIKRGNNDPIVKFRHNKRTLVSQLEYSRVIGCLMYAMINTRPDIAFVIGKISRSLVYEWLAGNEAEWLRNLIYEIPLWPKPISTISIRCDSAATLAKAYSQVYNGKSRHFGVRHSMIRELIMNGVIFVEFVRTQLKVADHLTKGLVRDLVRKAAIEMGLKST